MEKTDNRAVLCVILSNPGLSANRAPAYEAHLDGEYLCQSAQPLFDAARVVMGQGYPPDTLLTTRHEGSPFDSFIPAPIGKLAKWTVKERVRGGLSVERWSPFDERPRAVPRGWVKTREPDLACTQPHPNRSRAPSACSEEAA